MDVSKTVRRRHAGGGLRPFPPSPRWTPASAALRIHGLRDSVLMRVSGR